MPKSLLTASLALIVFLAVGWPLAAYNSGYQGGNGISGSGTGDVSSNTSTSVDSEIALFSGTGGKTIKRASSSGILKGTSGVLSAVTAPSGTIVGTSDTQTLTNKTVTLRATAVSDATSISANSDNSDVITQTNTQGAGTLTINNPTGTQTEGQFLEYRMKCTNAQTFSFGGNFRGSTTNALPTTSTGSSKTDYLLFQWNATDSKWDLVGFDYGH